MIPAEAVEAARAVMQGRPRADNLSYRDFKKILEAAAPHMLSHERQQTADAHRDAMVNARTVDKLNRAIEAVLIGCDAMDAGVRMQSGDQRTTSFAANAIRRSITEELSK